MTTITLIVDLTNTPRLSPVLPDRYALIPMRTEGIPTLGAVYLAAYDLIVADDDRRRVHPKLAVVTGKRAPDVSNRLIQGLACNAGIVGGNHGGLARTLLDASLKVAYERGVSSMALRVEAKNHAARAPYADAGFTPWKATR